MTSDGNSFNNFPGNRLTKFLVCGLSSIKANRDHAFFCSEQDFSFFTSLNFFKEASCFYLAMEWISVGPGVSPPGKF